MTKVAIPIKDNLLSVVFGECNNYIIYEISHKSVVSKRIEIPPKKTLPSLSKWINTYGITDIIVHQMDRVLIDFLATTKVNLFIGVPIDLPENIIVDFLNGTLHSNVESGFLKK